MLIRPSICNFNSAKNTILKSAIRSKTNVKKIPQQNWPKKIISGVQPTGALHLGNYLGAIQPWIRLQNSGDDVTYFIADLHSITLPQDPGEHRHNTLQLVATLLAAGIDPTKSNLFLQSAVKEHAELGWILGCLTTMARLSHLPQFKEKSATVKDIPLGLFVYPVLQAADILIYKATHVPVGEDQIQQLQLAQHLASLFNFKFGETFPVCHGMVANDSSARIKSLRDPLKKMSKSDPDPKSCIMLTDPPEQILGKIKKAVTDFTSSVSYDPETRPGVSNLLTIHAAVDENQRTVEEICEESDLLDTGKYKLEVANAVIQHLNPIRLRIEDYMQNPEYLMQVLDEGSDRARQVAEKTIDEVKEKVGLGGLLKSSSTKIPKMNEKIN